MKGMAGLEALKAEVRGQGFRRVRTLGGYVPLAAWTPYGRKVASQIDFASWWTLEGYIYEGTPLSAGPFARGVWELAS